MDLLYLLLKKNSNYVCKNNSRGLIILLSILLIGCVLFQFALKTVTPIVYNCVMDSCVAYAEDGQNNETLNVIENEVAKEKVDYIEEGKINISEHPFLIKLNDIMAGRIVIWSVYFDRMSWFGEEERIFDRTEYAHNQYIELSYKAGIPVGPLYLFFVLAVGYNVFKTFLKKEIDEPYIFFQVLMFCTFFVISMLDTGIIPMERAFIFIFYIISIPCFFIEEKNSLKSQ